MPNENGTENAQQRADPDDADFAQVITDVPAPDFKEYVYRLREKMRGAVALGLLVLLALEVVIGVRYVGWIVSTEHPENAKVLTDWLTSIITGTIALLGAATGFYYGTKE